MHEEELLRELPKKLYTGRCRLFVGGLPREITRDELTDLFTPFGDVSETFLSDKGFGFVKMDTRSHAVTAKEELDGKFLHAYNRRIFVRFAIHGATVKLKELPHCVSNEMLYHACRAFGEVERAVVIVDEKGKPTGEGIVEFERKSSATKAIAQINDHVFLMSTNSLPIIAEECNFTDNDDGLPERLVAKTDQLIRDRELGPRMAPDGSFEEYYGRKWKEHYEYERQKRAKIEQELLMARQRLQSEIELAYEEYQTQLLREDMRRHQEELERIEASKFERMQRMGIKGSHQMTSAYHQSFSPQQEIPKPPPHKVCNWNDAQAQVDRLLSENNPTSISADGASSSALPNFGNVEIPPSIRSFLESIKSQTSGSENGRVHPFKGLYYGPPEEIPLPPPSPENEFDVNQNENPHKKRQKILDGHPNSQPPPSPKASTSQLQYPNVPPLKKNNVYQEMQFFR
uniref:RRM domain-containing protein n=1 Tax=Acrobeloides nanus TaxID=290746 RepID=A0A914BWE5_9BILA